MAAAEATLHDERAVREEHEAKAALAASGASNGDATKLAPQGGKGAPPCPCKGSPPASKGAPAAPGGKGAAKGEAGKGAVSYKEKQALLLQQQEERLSAEEGYAGKELTPQEAAIIADGGTDQEAGPYAGRQFLPSRGYFACKRCGNCLYLAAAKYVFCPIWSSFDGCCKDSIRMKLEGDGRVEVACRKCGGHLGHIFEEESAKRTGQRQCVNDTSIQYVVFDPPAGTEEAGPLVLPTSA